jgi:MFS family permease
VAHIPTVKERLHLADSLLGASLLVGPAGLVLVMPPAGRLADRFGSARVIRPAGLYGAVLPLALWTAQSLATVTGSVLASGPGRRAASTTRYPAAAAARAVAAPMPRDAPVIRKTGSGTGQG